MSVRKIIIPQKTIPEEQIQTQESEPEQKKLVHKIIPESRETPESEDNSDEGTLTDGQYKEFSYELVRKLLKNEDFLRSYYKTLDASAFTKNYSRILKILFEYYEQSGTIVSMHILKAKIIEANYPEKEEILELIQEMITDKRPILDEAIGACIKHVGIDYIRKELKKLDDKYSDKDDVDQWINGMQKISQKTHTMVSNMSSVTVVDFAASFEDWSKERKDVCKNKVSSEIIKTSIDDLDLWIPTKKGTINSFLGRTKVGKSIIMSNLGFGAYSNGADVLIVILENSEFQVLNRLYARAGYVNYKKLQRWDFNPNQEEEIERRLSCYKNKMNKLWIFKGEQYNTTTLELENLLRILYERYGSKIDLMVVDYAQIFSSHRMRGEKNVQDWKMHEQIIWELKDLAINFKYDVNDSKNNMAIWTALQTNRGAWEQEPQNGGAKELRDVSVFDIAGGYNVIPALDNLVFINQNKEEKRAGLLRLTPSVARDDASSDSNHIHLECAYEYMMIDKNNTNFDWVSAGSVAELIQ